MQRTSPHFMMSSKLLNPRTTTETSGLRCLVRVETPHSADDISRAERIVIPR